MLIFKLTKKTSIFKKSCFQRLKMDNILSIDEFVENAIVTLFLRENQFLRHEAFTLVKVAQT